MKPICLKGFVMGIGAAQRTFLSPFMVSHAWRRRSALSVAVNDLSIRVVIRGRKSSIAREAESSEGIVLFSPILFLGGTMARAAPMKAYYGGREVCYDLSLRMHLCFREPLSVRRSP